MTSLTLEETKVLYEEWKKEEREKNERQNKMKQGTLIYDQTTDRMDINFGIEEYYGGLHCGEIFEVYINDTWIPTRIEYKYDWYLVGLSEKNITGLSVRI